MRGMGRVYKRGDVWWIEFWHNNRQYRESSKSEKKSDAEKLLRQRIGEMGLGKLPVQDVEKMTFKDLALLLITDYTRNQRRSIEWAKRRIRHLSGFFGNDYAVSITTERLNSYIQYRLDEGAKNGTINRDLAALSKMFRLGMKLGRVSTKPYIERLKESKPRQGFMEHNEYLAIKKNLPESYQDVLEFFYHTGWRKSEIHKLEWTHVDLNACAIKLDPALSKNEEGRLIVLTGELLDLIRKRWEIRALGCPFVFHVNGKQIRDWRESWKKACSLAGFEGKILHDFRRTAVRNLVRAGVPDKVAMQMTGHKTRSVFDRYNIVSEADIREAGNKLQQYLSRQSNVPDVIPFQKKFS